MTRFIGLNVEDECSSCNMEGTSNVSHNHMIEISISACVFIYLFYNIDHVKLTYTCMTLYKILWSNSKRVQLHLMLYFMIVRRQWHVRLIKITLQVYYLSFVCFLFLMYKKVYLFSFVSLYFMKI